MAEEPENRMLFDLRGKRKRVIQVIYVLLAIIMAASLIVIGLPGGINPLGGGGTGQNSDLAELAIDRAENLEKRVRQMPNNLNAREELIRARASAGQSLSEIDETTGQAVPTNEALLQYDKAAQAWNKYVKASKGDPDPAVAQLMATAFFGISLGGTVAQFEANIKEAVRAQEFVVNDAQKQADKGQGAAPVSQLTQLAQYQYLAQKPDEAEKSTNEALAAARSNSERQQVNAAVRQYKQQGKSVGRQLARAKKQAKQDGGKSLEQPAGSLGSSNSLTAPPTTP